MKKSLFLFLIVAVSKLFSQTTIYSETTFAGATYTRTLDWLVSNTAVVYPACNVAGSSGGGKLIGQSAATAGSFQEAGSNAINTSTFVNIQVSWNMIRGTSSSPALTFQWSNDAGSSWNTISYTAPGVGSWGAVSPISLPAAASGTIIYVRWTYSSAGGFGANYVGLDDILVSGTPSPSYYWNGSGALNNVTSWGINTNGTGANPPDFVTNNQNFYIRNNTAATLSGNWTFSGINSVLNVGDGSTTNKIKFTIPSTFALTISGGAKLNVTNNSTLTVANTNFPASTDVVLGTSSSVEFAQNTTSVTIWGLTYGNLSLTGSGDKAQPPSDNIIVQGDFSIGSGINYIMANGIALSTELSGNIACTGSITGGISNLTIDGSSSNTIGTLKFNAASNTINNLTLNRSGQTLTLGNSLTLAGFASIASVFTNGSLAIGSNSLTFNGPVTFPASTSNGVFIGSATSSLTINGSGAITNNLLMDQTSSTSKTLNNFTFDRASTTLTLGNDININTSVFTNGTLALNGKALALNGAITFPASASNGVFVGSTTSSLTIGAAPGGAITNNLYMSQSSAAARSLGLFANNRNLSTITLGNNLIVAGDFNPTLGILDLNGTLLTLSGNMTLPTNPNNKGFKGSSTSSVTIDGSSSSNITGNFYMVQTNSSTRSLSQLTMNRALQTLNIGNALETYGEIVPTAGTIASGGFLFIRSDASNKGRIATVGGSGGITGNVKVETFALAGKTGWTNLGPSGINGLTVASWEGQIPMACLSCPNNEYSAGGYFVSIQGWSEPTSTYVPMSYTDPLNPGTGYWVYLGDGFTTTNDITWTVTGTAVQGDQPISLTYAGPTPSAIGFNLISNPFASAISWSTIVNSNPLFGNSVDDAIYVYNPDVAGGTTSYASGFQSDPNGIGNNIPMGQGFYVQAFAPYTLTIHETDKVKSNAPLLKPSTTSSNDVGITMRLKVEDGNGYDMSGIRFHQDATTDFDRRLDALKLFSSPGAVASNASKKTTISTRSGNVDYSINSLPYANTQDAVIPVLVTAKATGQFTISGTDLENLPNSCVQLKDKLTNTVHDLKAGPYVCTINDTTSSPRFELRVCADITMSVNELKSNAAQHVLINNDANGVYVQFDYDSPVKSTISVTNILGQKIMDNKNVTVAKDKVTVDIPEKNQLIFVTVTSENGKVTKKIVR